MDNRDLLSECIGRESPFSNVKDSFMKMIFGHINLCQVTMEYYSALKMDEFLAYVTTIKKRIKNKNPLRNEINVLFVL